MLRTSADARRCQNFELGPPVAKDTTTVRAAKVNLRSNTIVIIPTRLLFQM